MRPNFKRGDNFGKVDRLKQSESSYPKLWSTNLMKAAL